MLGERSLLRLSRATGLRIGRGYRRGGYTEVRVDAYDIHLSVDPDGTTTPVENGHWTSCADLPVNQRSKK